MYRGFKHILGDWGCQCLVCKDYLNLEKQLCPWGKITVCLNRADHGFVCKKTLQEKFVNTTLKYLKKVRPYSQDPETWPEKDSSSVLWKLVWYSDFFLLI